MREILDPIIAAIAGAVSGAFLTLLSMYRTNTENSVILKEICNDIDDIKNRLKALEEGLMDIRLLEERHKQLKKAHDDLTAKVDGMR